MEHVGSTAVPRLAAKPVIDLLVVAESDAGIPRAIAALEAGGWSHQGDGGLPGRERFTSRSGLPYHHLYRRPGQ
ncbi:GrpB protein [Murinocardiopsis flavida]|uniref:GrpB protein n=1 Tax=Murinocardiopsis flavida TaxID=645275 RepID=A0A2P8CUZ4_9ACTN|nr:GrpB protein [Murinocardiopsis flavida]